MAGKRLLFFRVLEHISKSKHLGKNFPLLLSLMVAFLCIIMSPVMSKSQNVINSKDNIQNIVQQGKKLYDTGQFSFAIKVLQQAGATFRSSGDSLQEAMTLSNLSLAYQKLSLWTDAEKAIAQSLTLLKNLKNSKESFIILAQALDVQGQLQLAQGKTETALITWQQAASIYRKIGESTALTRNLINSAQALQALGHYRQANKILTEVSQSLKNQSNSPVKVALLLSLGNVLQVTGDLKESQHVLEQSLALALISSQNTSDILFSLGNTSRIGQEFEKASTYYQQAARLSVNPITRIQTSLNQLSLLIQTKQFPDALVLSSQIHSEISNLPPSRIGVEAKINLAQSLMKLGELGRGLGVRDEGLGKRGENTFINSLARLLAQAIQQAQSLQDRQAESYALGTLGELYEQNQQFSDAQNLTEKALFIAQSIDAGDITYQWQWQMGRLRKQQGDRKGAIAYYTQALKTLQSLRRDLVAINPDIQFSFRESVEPVYRELVALLLQTEVGDRGSISQENLRQARFVIESLQLAELDNFFRSACLEPKQELDPVVDKQDRQAAAIYPIILSDRLDVILKLPNQDLRHYRASVPQYQVENIVKALRKKLRDVTRSLEVIQLSQELYNWLIRPVEAELIKNDIKTLVFVLDSELQNVPMAVLYDRQQQKYLVEKYAIAITPGLQLFDPKPLQKVKLNVLTAGVAQERSIENRKFARLENVPQELKQIQSEIPKSEELLNQKFTEANLQNQLKADSFSVVHLATHGEFSSDPEKTFILTWDKLLQVKEFDKLLRVNNQQQSSTIELLVLSACKTAEGDKRAALGLAGIAVRAGARSTLATLWSVDDESTTNVMSHFYRELKTGVNKAEALRRAQLAVFAQDNSPFFWAPFVLVGNWL